jgi:hypothetical protein
MSRIMTSEYSSFFYDIKIKFRKLNKAQFIKKKTYFKWPQPQVISQGAAYAIHQPAHQLVTIPLTGAAMRSL